MFQSDKGLKQSFNSFISTGNCFPCTGINLFSQQPLLPTSYQISEEKPKPTLLLCAWVWQGNRIRAFHAMFGVTPLDSRVTRGSPSTSAHLHSVLMPRGAGTWLPTALGDNSSLSSHEPHLIHPPSGHLTSILFFSEPQGDGEKTNKQKTNNKTQKPDIC